MSHDWHVQLCCQRSVTVTAWAGRFWIKDACSVAGCVLELVWAVSVGFGYLLAAYRTYSLYRVAFALLRCTNQLRVSRLALIVNRSTLLLINRSAILLVALAPRARYRSHVHRDWKPPKGIALKWLALQNSTTNLKVPAERLESLSGSLGSYTSLVQQWLGFAG